MIKVGAMGVARDPSYITIHCSLSLSSLSYLFFAGHIEIHLGLISLFAYLTDNLPPDFLFGLKWQSLLDFFFILCYNYNGGE